MKPECPHLRKKAAGDEGYMWCDLTDRWCFDEAGIKCEEYELFLKEEGNDKDYTGERS